MIFPYRGDLYTLLTVQLKYWNVNYLILNISSDFYIIIINIWIEIIG